MKCCVDFRASLQTLGFGLVVGFLAGGACAAEPPGIPGKMTVPSRLPSAVTGFSDTPVKVAPAKAAPARGDRAAVAEIVQRTQRASPVLHAPALWPEALAAGKPTELRVSVLLSGVARGAAAEVSLRVSGLEREFRMLDDGRGPDLVAGDGIYSASIRMDAAAGDAGRCHQLRVQASVKERAKGGRESVDAEAKEQVSPGKGFTSPVRSLCVTRLPVGIAASNHEKGNVIAFVESGRKGLVLADEVAVVVREGVRDEGVEAVAALVGGRVVGSLPASRVFQLRLPAPLSAAELVRVLETLRKSPAVAEAMPNAVGGLATPPVNPVVTSDTHRVLQTGLDRMRVPRAWALSKGDAAQVIAVVDTGADFDHEDFWDAPGGTTTRFVTDVAGIVAADCAGTSCVAVSKATSCHATNVCNAGNAAADGEGHGTLAAGLLGAWADNSRGIAGVTWNPKVLAVRYAANNATSNALKLAQGINHSVARGARVISVSSAFPLFTASVALCPEVTAAEASGRLVVAAAGNDGGTGNNYPAACAGAMPVANSTVNASDQDVIHSGTLSSNLGAWVSLAAPGVGVLSTARTAAACPTCNALYVSPAGSPTPGYASVTGTSFSTPLAAGVAALVIARKPVITNADLRALLFNTGVALQAPAAHIRRIDALPALLSFNEGPSDITLSPGSIAENTNTGPAAGPGVSVGILTSTDADAGLTGHEYQVVGGLDQAFFKIGASGNELMLANGLLNHETKASYEVTVRSIDAGNAQYDKPLTVSVTNLDEPLTGTPSIAGAPVEGTTLTASTAGMADGDGPITCTFEWLRNGVVVATGDTYTLTDADVGATMSVRATCTAPGGFPAAAATSATIGPVGNVNRAMGAPTIVGTRTVGQTLTANTSGISEPDNSCTFSYQWSTAEDGLIAGATGSTYPLTNNEAGEHMILEVTCTDTHGTPKTLPSVSDAVAVGDPHLTTIDGLRYDFQGAGEFVLLRGAKGMEVQARMTPVSTASTFTDPYSGLAVGVSINTAVAARVGEKRITYQQAGAGQPAGKMELRIDGQLVSLPPEGLRLASGGRVQVLAGDVLQADFPDGTTMLVTPGWWAPHSVWYLNVSVFHTPAYRGLMGVRHKGSWLPALADGSSLGAMPAALNDRYDHLYVRLAESWRVGEGAGLFDYAPGTSPKSFAIKSWPPKAPPFVVPAASLPPGAPKDVAKPVEANVAKEQCRALEGKPEHADCLFDVQVTGHPGFARTHLLHRRLLDGLVALQVRELRTGVKPEKTASFAVVVARRAGLAGPVGDRKQEPAVRPVATGEIQFTLGGKDVGKPVPLDAKGVARIELPRDRLAGRTVGARYLPAKESVFLPAATADLSPLHIRKR